MNLPLIASTFAALQVERATEPSYRGEGDGRLVVLEVPENVSLDFFVVRRARARDETTGEVTERESSFTVRGR